jgi:two-component system, cell cycle sensor histidine kinase and response regulator CckA
VAHDAIIVRDPNHVIRYWNAGAERIYGWSADEAIGASARDLLYTRFDQFDEAARRVRADGHWRGELTQHTKWGDTIIADSSWTLVMDDQGQPESLFTVNTNITDRKREEAILLRAQRLDSLGTFAGGIAHDLNNVLTPILTSAQLLAEQESDPTRQKLLASIESSALRGAAMIRQVLSFARGVESQRVPIDLRELLAEFEELCATTLLKNITLSISISGRAKSAVGDRTQLLQVLMNLAANARDAMPHGGTLSVSTRGARVGRAEAERHRVSPGAFVVITVEDNGVGMSEATIARIFEPFFTTKPVGSGTGLGLATSLAIIHGHGGFLQVYSEPDHGSRFQVYLPSTTRTPPADDDVTEARPIIRGNGELIVVVDDEKELRKATGRALKRYGYSVAAVANGQEALDFLSRHGNVALVLTDLTMPVMDGATLAAALALSTPDLPIVAMSGLSANAGRADVAIMSAFLTKPFSTADLIGTVSRFLNPAEGATSG